MTLLTILFLALQDGAEPKAMPVEKEGWGFAEKYPGDVGIEKDPRVVLVENFENDDLKSRWSDIKGTEFAKDPVHGGQRSLKVTATLGKDTGGHLYKMLKPGHDRLHFRFYVRFPKDHGYVHHFVHLTGYNPPTAWPQGGAGERPKGDERFSTGIEPWGDWGRHKAPGAWHFYSYWCEMKASGDGKFWGNSPKGAEPQVIPTEQWICVEFMIQCNAVGKSDGEQAFWIDGKGGGRWSGYRWRTDPALNVDGVWLLYYITENAGKQNKVEPKKEDHVWFDDVVVAKEYIGPVKPRKR